MSKLISGFNQIGIIHSPFSSPKNMPIQPPGASGISGQLVLEPEYVPGLKDLEGFSHIYLLYIFHKVSESHLSVTPYLDTHLRGVFATRAPSRPNPIGLSIVRLLSIENNILNIENLDILDGTPVLDIKPYIPPFDDQVNVRIGWLTEIADGVKHKRSER